ncbi:AAA family ATPase [Enterovirga aerilata]|uniref:AAA family ATPase n=1 Tax=Enterovirga aerilata TaxID=2730920 RepID=A0A849IDL8_9HYPH|nr:AAA family ATPase [Enterovirga sp. DB1703]
MTDRHNRCLWRGGERLDVTPKAFEVLDFLRRNPDRLVSQDEILDAVWPDTFVQPEIVKTYVRTLRRLLEDDVQKPRFIETRPRCGYRFVGVLPERSECPVPTDRPFLVGRDSELVVLRRSYEAACRGERSCVIVTGEGGIGKSALSSAFAQGLDGPARIAAAYGSPGAGEELGLARDLMADLARTFDAEPLHASLSRHGTAWLGRVPFGMVDAPPVISAPSVSAGQLAREACAVLEDLSQVKPLVLFLEDLQWVDEASLDFLSSMLRRRYPAQIFILATFRRIRFEGRCAVRERLDDLLIHELARELPLPPLNIPDIEALLRRHAPDKNGTTDMPEADPRASHDRLTEIQTDGGGNPLILQGLAQALPVPTSRRLTGEVGPAPRLPEMLRASLDLQLRDSGPFLRGALEAGSIAGERFCAWAVAVILDTEQAAIEDLFAELAGARQFLVHESWYALPDGVSTPIYAFKYRAQRRFLLESQAPSRRAQRYRKFGEAIVNLWAGDVRDVAGDVSVCFKEAGDWKEAIGYARLAATAALQRSAPSEAEHFLKKALGFASKLPTGEQAAIQLPLRRDLETLTLSSDASRIRLAEPAHRLGSCAGSKGRPRRSPEMVSV